eukprot:TRINITY_DN20763_c0_g1_i2.p1 TRINITY_DN20763_c0_g1~~TRINITY_DN20763_c0_g1_i2.p1  ORF type:complete len:203 (+),score=14.87 TRINITY_DN20763_c0_g1_i2:69-677(+)
MTQAEAMAVLQKSAVRLAQWIQLHEGYYSSDQGYHHAILHEGDDHVYKDDAEKLIENMAAHPHLASIRQLMRPSKRHSLRRVLTAFALKYPRCGVNAVFAPFIGITLIIAGSEQAAFKLAIAIYERLRLKEYFESSEDTPAALQTDIDLTVHMLQVAVPELTAAFEKHNASDLLVRGEGIPYVCARQWAASCSRRRDRTLLY